MPLLWQRVASKWISGMLHEASVERLADVSKRLMDRLMAEGQSFGNISAHRPTHSRKENKAAMTQLHDELQRRGYRPIPTYSTWTDDKTQKKYQERSFMVPDARPEDMLELGHIFGQDSVIYKSSTGSLGMYYTGDNPRALLAQKEDGTPDFEVQTIKPPKKEKGHGPRPKEREQEELFSRSRGLNFSFNFDWGNAHPFDGHTPLDKEGKPDPTDLGSQRDVRAPPPRTGPTGFEQYLSQFWDAGKRRVPNTHPDSRERYPKVEMLTLFKSDPSFRRRIVRDYQRRRDQGRQQERAQPSPAMG